MAPVFLEAGERFQIVHAIREKPWKKIIGRYMTIEDGVREQIGYKLKEKKKIHWWGWVQGTKEGGYVNKIELEPNEVIHFPNDTEPALTATGIY